MWGVRRVLKPLSAENRRRSSAEQVLAQRLGPKYYPGQLHCAGVIGSGMNAIQCGYQQELADEHRSEGRRGSRSRTVFCICAFGLSRLSLPDGFEGVTGDFKDTVLETTVWPTREQT